MARERKAAQPKSASRTKNESTKSNKSTESIKNTKNANTKSIKSTKTIKSTGSTKSGGAKRASMTKTTARGTASGGSAALSTAPDQPGKGKAKRGRVSGSWDEVQREVIRAAPELYFNRILALMDELVDRRPIVDSILIADRMDGYYLTGFSGEDGYVLLTKSDVVLLTDGRFKVQASREAPWATLVLREGRFPPVLADVAYERYLKNMGFFESTMSVGAVRMFNEALKEVGCRLVPFDGEKNAVGTVRERKGKSEVAKIRAAIAAAETGFLQTLKVIKPGITELDIAAELVYQMTLAGAACPSFEPIVAVGANASLPHYRPGKTVLTANTGLLIDWGARVDQYCSDLTRVLLPPKVKGRWIEVYDAVREAQRAAIDMIEPDVPLRAVDAAARKVLRKAGLAKYFNHGLGHGIGLNIHEGPRLSQHVDPDLTLTPGMVVTVEPGVYLPEELGVRIEDDVLVTDYGHDVLTTLTTQRYEMTF